MSKFQPALQSIGSDFVFGFIQAMDGEKDPRNLVLVFQLVKIIIRNFPIGLFVEDLFEVTSCYFPIDFTPPPDDPHAIKKDDLVMGLRTCLAATELFAPFCFPLLLEKLSSDIIAAKIDSLKTLAMCLDVYSSKHLIEHLAAFWTGIKREVYQTVNIDLEESALQAITSIIRNLAKSKEENPSQQLKDFVENMQKDCFQQLCGPGITQVKPSRRILEAAAGGADVAYWMIFSSSVPVISEQLTATKEGNRRTTFINLLSGLLKSAQQFHKGEAGSESSVFRHKGAVSSLLFLVLSGSAESAADKCSAVDGLMCLVDVMTEDEVKVLVQHLTVITLNVMNPPLREKSVKSLAQLARQHPGIIRKVLLPQLEAELKRDNSSVMEVDDGCPTTTHIGHQGVLDTLSSVCTEDSVVRDVVPQLVEHAKALCRVHQVTEDLLDQVAHVFKCLFSVVDDSLGRHAGQSEFFKEHLVPELFRLAIEPTLREPSDQGHGHVMTNGRILEDIASILRTITGNLETESSKSFLESVLLIFLDDKVPFSVSNGQLTFSPLKDNSPWQQTQLVVLLVATVCAVKSEVEVPRQWELLDKLRNLACRCPHKKTAGAAAQGLAGIINKAEQGEELNARLKTFMKGVLKNNETEDSTWRAVISWIWLTKALVLRAHPLAQDFVQTLLSLLTVHGTGRIAADGFYIIMADCDEVMNQKMHANMRMMYRQRFFIEALPQLLDGFHAASPDFKSNYLCALSHLLQWVPKQVLLTEVPKLMPLLVQSLSCEESSLKLTTLQTLYSLILATPETVTRHVTSLIPQFLSLSKNASAMNVRSEALKCLGAMTSLPHHVVYPYKNTVTRSLADCLDDKKRLVRREAVKCRHEWFMLGT